MLTNSASQVQAAALGGLGGTVSADPLSFRKMPTIGGKTRPDQALQIGQKFEAMYLSEMLQPMFAGIKTDGIFGGGHGEEMFRSLQIDEFAKAITKTGGVGIAAAVQKEVLRIQEQAHVPAPAAN